MKSVPQGRVQRLLEEEDEDDCSDVRGPTAVDRRPQHHHRHHQPRTKIHEADFNQIQEADFCDLRERRKEHRRRARNREADFNHLPDGDFFESPETPMEHGKSRKRGHPSRTEEDRFTTDGSRHSETSVQQRQASNLDFDE